MIVIESEGVEYCRDWGMIAFASLRAFFALLVIVTYCVGPLQFLPASLCGVLTLTLAIGLRFSEYENYDPPAHRDPPAHTGYSVHQYMTRDEVLNVILHCTVITTGDAPRGF